MELQRIALLKHRRLCRQQKAPLQQGFCRSGRRDSNSGPLVPQSVPPARKVCLPADGERWQRTGSTTVWTSGSSFTARSAGSANFVAELLARSGSMACRTLAGSLTLVRLEVVDLDLC